MRVKKIISAVFAAITITSLLPIQWAFADDEVSADENTVEAVIFNKLSPEYVEIKGIFQDDVRSVDPYGKTTRYCFSRNGKVGYRFNVAESGNYKIEYWNPPAVNCWSQRNQQLFTITVNDAVSEVKLNLKYQSGWMDLGVYTINTGDSAEVVLSREVQDGAIRSGALRLTKSEENPYIKASDAVPTVRRDYPEGNGKVVENAHLDESCAIEEIGGGFSGVAMLNALGYQTRYSYNEGASARFKIVVPQGAQKKYHIMFWVYNFPESDKRHNKKQSVFVKSAGTQTEFIIDNTVLDGWVYLGEYTLTEKDNYVEVVNGEKGKMLIEGGAYFAEIDDAEFDPSKYPMLTPSEIIK